MGIEGFHAAYPQADPAAVLTPEALAQAPAATNECSDTVRAIYSTIAGGVLAHDPLSIPAFQKLLHQNSAGNRPSGAPLLIVQGTVDTTIPKILTDAFAKKACAAGDTVDYRTYEGAAHGSIIVAARDDLIAWLADRAAGRPAPSTCS
jgi:acetyl esterase/lipase